MCHSESVPVLWMFTQKQVTSQVIIITLKTERPHSVCTQDYFFFYYSEVYEYKISNVSFISSLERFYPNVCTGCQHYCIMQNLSVFDGYLLRPTQCIA